MSDLDFVALREKLAARKQDHVLKFFDVLNVDQKAALYHDLADLDLQQLEIDFRRARAGTSIAFFSSIFAAQSNGDHL